MVMTLVAKFWMLLDVVGGIEVMFYLCDKHVCQRSVNYRNLSDESRRGCTLRNDFSNFAPGLQCDSLRTICHNYNEFTSYTCD